MDEVLLRVQAVAAKQHSVISTEQMAECGASRTWITRRRREGFLDRIGPSIYRMPGVGSRTGRWPLSCRPAVRR